MTAIPAPAVPADAAVSVDPAVSVAPAVPVDSVVSADPMVSVGSAGPAELIAPEPYFPDLSSFVRHIVVAALLPRVDGRTRTWCVRWWEHPGAVMRLEALWRAWEVSRIMQDDLAMSCWVRDHADYHLDRLLDPEGTFRGCSPERGHQPRGTAPAWHEPPAML